ALQWHCRGRRFDPGWLHQLPLLAVPVRSQKCSTEEGVGQVRCPAGTGAGAGVRVIHGYGSTGTGGVLRARLRGFCDTHADRVGYARGEDAEENPGVTVVTVRAALPDARLGLAY
ncbi:MAG: Smr/MutS family protein, partial [Gammaproteobacteria bacterium]|nr:Smr/MutS family protein [Gammaproteobacteria bacterium]